MTIHRPKVSIGMPVYNGEPYVTAAVESILTQTYQDLELIISDNASTDGTREICESYAKCDPRVRYVRQKENQGAARNYNYVADVSRGRYFKWAAADDLCAPQLVERCVAVLDQQADVVVCYPKTAIIDEHGAINRHYDDGLKLDSVSPIDRFGRLIYVIGECNAVFGLIRSDVLKKTPRIGNYRASDQVLLAELSLYGQFNEIAENLFFRRVHPRASSSNKSTESQQEFFDPRTKGKVSLPNWRHQAEYLRSIMRAPLPFSAKCSLARIVLHRGIMFRNVLARELSDETVRVIRKSWKRHHGSILSDEMASGKKGSSAGH
jgi:glycosyltransferase involved in cell wall biosynthesis